MKKKFVGILTASFALVLTLGMTVCASPSPSADDDDDDVVTEELAESYSEGVAASNTVVLNGKTTEVEVTISSVTEEVVNAAQQQAKAMVSENASVLKTFDVSLPEGDYSAGVQVTMQVPGVAAGQKIAALHQKSNGSWESLPVNKVENGAVTVTFTSFSPVAIVTYSSSPKTGEVMPFVAVMAIVCLMGTAVCVKKLSYR